MLSVICSLVIRMVQPMRITSLLGCITTSHTGVQSFLEGLGMVSVYLTASMRNYALTRIASKGLEHY